MEQKNAINLGLRSEILEASLILESVVSKLLISLLVIEKQKKKAISNRSGNLSFKNRIDLLFDLDILDKKEHQKLLLLMELRNQFLHNIECTSFSKAIDNLGIDKGKKLLKFYTSPDQVDQETQYKIAFNNLKIECLEIILAKIIDREKQINELSEFHISVAESHIFLIEKYFDTITDILKIFERNASESQEVKMLFDEVQKTITNDINALETSEVFQAMQSKYKNLTASEKIKALFMRQKSL